MLFVKCENDSPDVGFNLQNYQQNRYKNTEELRKQIKKQLKIHYGVESRL